MNIIDSSRVQVVFDVGENWKVIDSVSEYLILDSTSFNDIYCIYDKQLKDSIPCLVFRNSEGFAFYISKRKAMSTYITDEKIYYHPQWAQVFLPRNRENKYSSLPVMFNK